LLEVAPDRSDFLLGFTTYSCRQYLHGTTNPHSSLLICTISASVKAYLAEQYMSGAKSDAILARTTTMKKKARLIGDRVMGARRIW